MLSLYPHQVNAIEMALKKGGSLALFHEPGLGKTRTCLEIYQRLRLQHPALKMLVVCPLSLVEAAWKTDTEKFTSLRWCALKKYDKDADVFVINFESIIRPAGQRLLDESGLSANQTMLVIDESSRLRDPRSLTTKTLLKIAQGCACRVACSGTPSPNNLSELWGQISVVDPNLLHRSFWAFRRTYFYLGRNGHKIDSPPPSRRGMADLFKLGYEWKITPENQKRLLEQIAPVCSWVRKADALPDLPERITQIRHVTLTPEEHAAYERMRKELVVEFENEYVTAEIALTKLQKLRQLSSGFLYGDTTHTVGKSRLKVLLETLEELGNQPVIIWCQFRVEIQQVAAALGDKAVTLYGGTDNRNESLRRFGTDVQYLIAHPRSAAHGLTLTQASTCVWFSLDWSLEAHLQANDRIHRIGQKKSCLYIYLIAPGRIDEQIWDVLQKKRTLQEAIDSTLGGKRPPRRAGSDQKALAEGVDIGRSA